MWYTVIVTSLLLWSADVDCSINMTDYVQQGNIKYQQIMQRRIDYAAYDVDPTPHSCRWAMGKMQHQEDPDGVECEAQAINQLQTTRLLLALGLYPSLASIQNDQIVVDSWRVVFPHCFDGACVDHCNDPIKTYYRTADGSCNNDHRRTWGKSFTAQQRFMEPAYGDQYNIGDPRDYSVAQDGDGNHYKLPAARAVSVAMFGDSDEYNDDLDHKFTVEFMAWGQFTDHDVVFTPTSSGSGESNINCCHTVNGAYLDREECFRMVIPDGDHRFTKKCMNFVRSVPAARTDGYCKPSWREQLNQVTAFIDGSNVYGSTYTKQYELRDTGNNSHLLKVHGHDFPVAGDDSECILPSPKGDLFCLNAGDERSNEVTNLGYHHILFVRLHNKIADKLKHCWRPHDYHFKNENIKNEYYFQEARKIIIAIMQKITYKDWLPKVIGQTLMKKHKLRVGYDEDNAYDSYENPSIHNAFAAAAFRFGHSLIPKFQSYNIKDPATPYYYAYKDQTFTTHDLKDVFFRPNLLQQDQTGYLDEFSNWLLYDRCKMSDRRFTKMVTDHLFEDSVGDAFDLAARNIQRGRDHGIKGYTEWREFAGFDPIHSWDDLEQSYTHKPDIVHKLKSVYKSVHDIDLFVGGMTEKHVGDGVVGPTFAHIIAKQFHALKHGDSFWYERRQMSDHSSLLTKGQIKAINEWTLAKIICEIMNLHEIQEDVFKIPYLGEIWQCQHLPDLDLTHWGCLYPDGSDYLHEEDMHLAKH